MELQIRNISKTYPGGVRALANVSLTIAGGVFGLLGPTGAGKTTLSRILARLQEPDEGSVPEAMRKTLGYLPQEFGGRPKVAVEKVLDRLLQFRNAAERPTLLILDEPTAGLEPPERLRVLDLVHDLGENNTVLLSTQNVQDVSEVCTRVAIINAGSVLLEADPQCAAGELCGRIWTREIAKEALPRVQREYAVISTKELAGRPVVRVYSNVAPAVGFERAKPELEDVYFSTLAGHIGDRHVHVG